MHFTALFELIFAIFVDKSPIYKKTIEN